jgi:hypothetical protein
LLIADADAAFWRWCHCFSYTLQQPQQAGISNQHAARR